MHRAAQPAVAPRKGRQPPVAAQLAAHCCSVCRLALARTAALFFGAQLFELLNKKQAENRVLGKENPFPRLLLHAFQRPGGNVGNAFCFGVPLFQFLSFPAICKTFFQELNSY